MIEIEVIYPLPQEQVVEKLRVPIGTTVGQALERSCIPRRYPDISTDSPAIGIYGQRADLARVLREFDRIEIYRPLLADPKVARRRRARQVATPPR
jgi:putative ubiquitin-RnfH superfamily antitoxin RatB of RatAB toxin-antitoxin module